MTARGLIPPGALLGLLLSLTPATAQEIPTGDGAQDAAEQAQREKDFEESMSGVQLVGFFSMDGSPDQGLTEERYTIHKVTKMGGGYWRFDARVEYGGKDVTVPIPLKVFWAGDTPVITLTDLMIPGLGTYTARVLIYRGQYAGTWSGSDYGGKLFGRIEPLPEEESEESAEKPATKEEV